MNKDLKCWTMDKLKTLLEDMGQKPYIAKYIFSFIHNKLVNKIELITPLSKEFRQKLLDEKFYISEIKKTKSIEDTDGTIKYLFELPDENNIEAVLLLDDDRKTLCISTQAGCAMNCSFCATAKIKLKRDLSAAEIADQIYCVTKDGHEISNVVYMGMGEPFDNYDNVLDSVRLLNHPDGLNIGIRRITLSTCGIVPGIMKLAHEDIKPRLAVSLNAPTDVLRSKIMPINKKYPIDSIFEALRTYCKATKNRVTFEYVLIQDVNDSVTLAQMLIKKIRDINCNINLIQLNPHSHSDLKPADNLVVQRFANVLKKAGFEVTTRFRRGRGINAACGQLGIDLNKNTP